jgi:hypothetical protein
LIYMRAIGASLSISSRRLSDLYSKAIAISLSTGIAEVS